MSGTKFLAAMAVAMALTLSAPVRAEGMAMDAPAQVVTVGHLEISGGFTRATLPNAPVGGGFLTITNTGSEDDTLLAAASPASAVVQLHEMKMEGDVMKMAELPGGIPVPAGATVTLEPGGLHIMFMHLAGPLVEGSTVPVTLTFARAGTVEVALSVLGFAAKAPGMTHGDAAGADHAAHMHHGSGAGMDMSGMTDEQAIAHMQAAMFDKPDSPLEMGPIVVAGDYAISDWAQGDMGGRALLRRTAKGWGIHLCSGDGLKDAGNLATIGVPADIAGILVDKLAAAEAPIDPAALALYGSFDGTAMIDPELIKAGS